MVRVVSCLVVLSLGCGLTQVKGPTANRPANIRPEACASGISEACASGISCDYDVDCPSNSACNSDTRQCFSKSAYCIGLPCTYDVDCPTNEKYNSAEHACIAR